MRTKEPLYLQIYADLKNKINGGEYKDGEFLPSERELGEHYKVERATVRRALELLVKDELLIKQPGSGSRVQLPRALGKNEFPANNIAFILPADSPDKITEPFTSNIFYHFERECSKQNYHLFYANLTSNEELPENLLHNGLKAIVWVSKIPQSLIVQASEYGIPSILISNSHPDCVSILCDNNGGIYQAINHLASLGHKKIAYLGGTPTYLNAAERRDSYLSAVSHAGFNLNPELVLTGDWTFESGYENTVELLRKTRDFTAICCANDVMALGAIKAVTSAGLSVPHDISVIGFDNIGQCLHSTPTLSTIGIDAAVFAKQIMYSLSGMIAADGSAPPVKILLQTQLFPRESTTLAPM